MTDRMLELPLVILLVGVGAVAAMLAKELLARFWVPAVLLAGTGFALAAVARLLGLSVAIGAFFAGLAFSRDQESGRYDVTLETLHYLLAPFFFIGIGLSIRPSAAATGAGAGAVLLAVAVEGKLGGTMLPAWPSVGARGAAALGLSMVPRAEITAAVMPRGLELGEWAVTAELFAVMALVVVATSFLAPPAVRALLFRDDDWPSGRPRRPRARQQRGCARPSSAAVQPPPATSSPAASNRSRRLPSWAAGAVRDVRLAMVTSGLSFSREAPRSADRGR